MIVSNNDGRLLLLGGLITPTTTNVTVDLGLLSLTIGGSNTTNTNTTNSTTTNTTTIAPIDNSTTSTITTNNDTSTIY